ncbi:MAG: hypothetical protein ACKVN9_00710 [Methylophilaceae bacterium]
MKNFLVSLALTTVLVAPLPTNAQDATFLWFVQSIAQISECSQYGIESQQELQEAFATGRSNSLGKLPPSFWDSLEKGISKTAAIKAPSTEAAEKCQTIVSQYRNPRFSVHFRQIIAIQLTGPGALACIIEKPDTEQEIKKTWLAAFERNGMELSELTIDKMAENARKDTNGIVAKLRPSVARLGCEEVIMWFSVASFDSQFSEEALYNYLAKKK